MNIMKQATIAIMFGSDKRKMRRINKLIAEKDLHWQKYLEAKKKLQELTGLP